MKEAYFNEDRNPTLDEIREYSIKYIDGWCLPLPNTISGYFSEVESITRFILDLDKVVNLSEDGYLYLDDTTYKRILELSDHIPEFLVYEEDY